MNWQRINKIRRFLRIGIFKTLYLNFAKLPLKQALKIPILIPRNAYIYDFSGKIKIEEPVKSFNIRFGYFGEDTKMWKDDKILFKINGVLVFRGESHFGNGVSIRVEKGAKLTIGNNVRISNNTKIICYDEVVIGDNCRIAWECQIIDTNFHHIRNIETGELALKNIPIKIGNNNWIGNRSNIMKGTVTPDYCIIAANSLCNKKYEIPQYSLIAGSPAKLLKTGIYRVLDAEESEIENKSGNSILNAF